MNFSLRDQTRFADDVPQLGNSSLLETPTFETYRILDSPNLCLFETTC
jgi:hypothetical protein